MSLKLKEDVCLQLLYKNKKITLLMLQSKNGSILFPSINCIFVVNQEN